MAQRIVLGIVLALLAGCGSQQTTLQFNAPAGSVLSFKNAKGTDINRVVFPGTLNLEQTDTPGSEPKLALSGRIRINDLVEAAAVPAKARHYLVQADGGVEVKVAGYYQVFSYSPTRIDRLAKIPVELDRDQLLQLLSGKPVDVEGKAPSGQTVYHLVLGLEG